MATSRSDPWQDPRALIRFLEHWEKALREYAADEALRIAIRDYKRELKKAWKKMKELPDPDDDWED